MLLQRDLRGLAHLLATSSDTSEIPKTLIFSQTKEDVYKVYSFLRAYAKHPQSVSMFHASQSDKTRASVQSSLLSLSTELRCVSATIAFGMVRMYIYICICVLYMYVESCC